MTATKKNTISVDLDLADKIGLKEAAFIALVERGQAAKAKRPEKYKGHFSGGFWWVYNTYKSWAEQHPWFGSDRTVRRIADKLTAMGAIVIGNYNRMRSDKTLWYRVCEKTIDAIKKGLFEVPKLATGSGQNGHSVVTNCPELGDKMATWTGQIGHTITMSYLHSLSHVLSHNVNVGYSTTSNASPPVSPSFAFFADKNLPKMEQPAKPVLPKADPLPKQPERKAIAGHPNQELLARMTAIPSIDIAQAKGLLVSYGEERVTAQLNYLAYRKADNPAATLRASLRNDWEAPPEYLKQSQLDAQKQEMARQAQALEEQWEREMQVSKARREEEQRQRKAEEARWNALTPEQQQAEREKKERAYQNWLERRKANNPLTAIRAKVFANCHGGAGK